MAEVTGSSKVGGKGKSKDKLALAKGKGKMNIRSLYSFDLD